MILDGQQKTTEDWQTHDIQGRVHQQSAGETGALGARQILSAGDVALQVD